VITIISVAPPHPKIKVADNKNLVTAIEKAIRRWMTNAEKNDWRFLFVLVDSLLLIEIGNAGQSLDKLVRQLDFSK